MLLEALNPAAVQQPTLQRYAGARVAGGVSDFAGHLPLHSGSRVTDPPLLPWTASRLFTLRAGLQGRPLFTYKSHQTPPTSGNHVRLSWIFEKRR